jgi:tRNA pseudouridine38-40 synthase
MMSEADPLVRVRLDISYDGTDFSGWARQPQRRTVQGVLEDALCVVLRLRELSLTVAGRTDAGVHATGQVAHADLPSTVWAEHGPRLVRALAGVLPADLRVLGVRLAPADFDARFAGLWRRYEYRISDVPGGVPPLRRHVVLGWPRPLDVAAMNAAARLLLGLHDFAAFCRQRETGTTIRTVESFDVARAGDEVVCTIQADAFCHSMVRSLVGALLAVGDGRHPPEWPAQLLGASTRSDRVGVAPAHGLTLIEVGYPPDEQLASRIERTRALRETPLDGGDTAGT